METGSLMIWDDISRPGGQIPNLRVPKKPCTLRMRTIYMYTFLYKYTCFGKCEVSQCLCYEGSVPEMYLNMRVQVYLI